MDQIKTKENQNTTAAELGDLLPTFLNWLVLVPLVRGGTPISRRQCVDRNQEKPLYHQSTKTTEREKYRPQHKNQKNQQIKQCRF